MTPFPESPTPDVPEIVLEPVLPVPAATDEVDKALLATPPVTEAAGLDEVSARDLQLPQLKLRQLRTENADRVPEGSWFLTSDPDGHALAREVVLLDVRKERSLLLPYAGGEAAEALAARIEERTGVVVPAEWEGPVCFSRDRVRPVTQEGIAPLAEDCASCPMARWRTAKGRRLQDCAESYRLLFHDVATDMPVVYFARGAALRPARDLLTNLHVACRREGRPAFAYSVELFRRHVDGPEGGYYVPVFGRPYPIEDAARVERLAAIRAACTLVQAEED